MIDPTLYFLISSNQASLGGLSSSSSSSLFDYDLTSDGSNGSPCHQLHHQSQNHPYGDPFVGSLSYYADQQQHHHSQVPSTVTTPTTTTSSTTTGLMSPSSTSIASNSSTTSSAASAHNNTNNNSHHHHHHHHQPHQQDDFMDHSPSHIGDLTALDPCGTSSSALLMDSCELNDDDDDDLIHGALTGFVCPDLGAESDTGYTSGLSEGMFTSSSSLVDCTSSGDSADAYCLKQFSFSDSLVSLVDDLGQLHEQHHIQADPPFASTSIRSGGHYTFGNCSAFMGSSSSLCTTIASGSSSSPPPSSSTTSGGMTGTSDTSKRSVLMNLLIYGSDIGAGYTSIKS